MRCADTKLDTLRIHPTPVELPKPAVFHGQDWRPPGWESTTSEGTKAGAATGAAAGAATGAAAGADAGGEEDAAWVTCATHPPEWHLI